MDKSYLKRILSATLTVCVSVAIIAYIGYHFFKTSGNDVELLAATNMTVDDSVEYTAYIMRSEKVVYAPDGGVSYRASGGQKVAADTVVARVFGTGGDDVRAKLVSFDSKLSILTRSSVDEGTRFNGTSIIDSQINDTYATIMSKLENGELEYAMRKKDELGILLNRRKILVKDVENFDETIDRLTAEQNELIETLGQSYTEVTVPESGYFYTDVDGYEQVFSSDGAMTMDVADFDTMIASSPDPYIGNGQAIGKLVTDFKWYVAIEIPQREIIKYNTEYKYNVVFPYNSDQKIIMRLERMVTSPDGKRCVLVLSSSEMPKNFNFLRAQTVQIVSTSFTGYRVPTSAVRVINGVTGVYILDGSIVRFKRIRPMVEIGGYVVVEKQDTSDPDSLQNDLGYCNLIITDGKNLYDGKIVE